MDNIPSYERYQRQMILKEFGEAAQQKLLQAKVIVIGARGLGCPALQYMTAAGADIIGLNNQVYQISLSAGKETCSLIPESEAAFTQTNYEWLCASSFRNPIAPDSPDSYRDRDGFEIDIENFNTLLRSDDITVIDVREPDKIPVVNEFISEKIPLSQLKEKLAGIKNDTVVFFCQTGKRSLQAAR